MINANKKFDEINNSSIHCVFLNSYACAYSFFHYRFRFKHFLDTKYSVDSKDDLYFSLFLFFYITIGKLFLMNLHVSIWIDTLKLFMFR